MKRILDKPALKEYLTDVCKLDLNNPKDLKRCEDVYNELIKDIYITLCKNGFGTHTKECIQHIGKNNQ